MNAVEVLRKIVDSGHRCVMPHELEALDRLARLVEACKARDAAIEAIAAYDSKPVAIAANWRARDEYREALAAVLGEEG